MGQPFISVIVPCYNESENIARGVLDEMYAFLSVQSYTFELIISDDESRDDSRELIRAWMEGKDHVHLLENKHGGKPFAVMYGILAAKADLVLFTDMDQSTSIDQLALLLPWFDQGYDIVIGSRGMDRADFPLYRRLGSRIFGAFRRLFLLRYIQDTQCGFKAMRTEVGRDLFPKLWVIRDSGPASGWRVTAFDVELLSLADSAGHRIAEVTVAWANRDVAENKAKSYLAESREMAEQILRVKWNQWTGYYDQPSTPDA